MLSPFAAAVSSWLFGSSSRPLSRSDTVSCATSDAPRPLGSAHRSPGCRAGAPVGNGNRRTHCLRSLPKAWSRRQDVHRLGLCAASWISVASSGMVSLATVWRQSRKIFCSCGSYKGTRIKIPDVVRRIVQFSVDQPVDFDRD